MMNAFRDHRNKLFEIGDADFAHVAQAVDEDRARLQLIDVAQKRGSIEFVGIMNTFAKEAINNLFVLKIAMFSHDYWAVVFLG